MQEWNFGEVDLQTSPSKIWERPKYAFESLDKYGSGAYGWSRWIDRESCANYRLSFLKKLGVMKETVMLEVKSQDIFRGIQGVGKSFSEEGYA